MSAEPNQRRAKVPSLGIEQVHQQLLETLHAAMRQRPRRQDLVDGEPGWMRQERAVMHAAVNELRRSAGLPPVTAAEIQHAEQPAVWHVDYAQKWTLACAWLACQPPTAPR